MKEDKDNKSSGSSCQRTQATEVYTISSDAPYRLALDDPQMGRNGGALHNTNHGFDFEVQSQKSWSSAAYDGVNVLGSEKPDNFNTWSQRRAAAIVNTPLFKRSTLVLILICSVAVAAKTIVSNLVLDRLLDAFLFIFTCEVVLSAVFYQDQMFGWVVFDGIILLSSMYTGDRSILVLRSFRLLRAFRKASGVPELRWVVKSILRALPRIAIACCLMACSLLTFAIWFTSLYPSTFPRIDQSSFILFQMTTGGLSWGETLAGLTGEHPTAWLPMILFVITFRYVFWSLIIAVMCDAVFHANDSEQAWKSMEGLHNTDDEVTEMLKLTRKVDSLQSTLSALLQSQASLVDSVHQLKDRSICPVPSDETTK